MKIKIALLDNDQGYLNKISAALKNKYEHKLELYIFTSKQNLLNSVDLNSIHILIVNNQIFDLREINDVNIAKIYFSETKEINKIDNFETITKFQKISEFYERIKNIYESHFDIAMTANSTFKGQTKLITYTSYSGGTGTSTIAISEAVSKAAAGAKVLYLNLEYFDTTDIYFESSENSSFSNVVFLIKKDSLDLVSKLEKVLIQHKTGVFYCSSPAILLDKLEINNVKDIHKLFDALKQIGFDYIIIDRNIDFSLVEKFIFESSNDLRFVVDGSKTSNHKFLKLINSLSLIDEREETNVCQKISVIYNKMSSSSNNIIQNKKIPVLAMINKYKTYDDKMIINEIVANNFLTNI
ncbi:hypothetical protein [Thomasclavelia saccharogumia]|uniref:hypothetical protein n=1 Tax=Thomasclavelia saccharogumia TaxID=341225 RepID=UPI000478AE56|nr:hypothetical protein [Thomasclavelia saccharogumia]